MKLTNLLLLLAAAGSSHLACAATIFDTGSASSYTARPADDGLGQGLSAAADTTITAFGFDFFMPEGGNARFMIWDDLNSTPLYNEIRSFAPGAESAFHFTSGLGAFTLTAGTTYYFGLIGDAEIDAGYFFPPLELTQGGLSLLQDGNSNYADFTAPFAVESGGATIALRLTGDQAPAAEAPEPSTWVTVIGGFALLVAGSRAKGGR